MTTKPTAWLGALTIALAALLLPVGPAGAQATGFRADRAPAAEAAISALERQLCQLLVRGDWDAYARHLTDDYVRVLPGKVQTKAEVLREFRGSGDRMITMVPEKIRTRVYGDAAIVMIDLYTRNRSPTGAITESRGRGIKVFVRRHGQWYLAQLTAAPS
jgi:ketosteroid isomerase-like protein